MKTVISVMLASIACIFFASATLSQAYSEGMISCWSFDDGSGTTAIDSIGTNDGTVIGGATWTTGKVNGALSFDGIDDYVMTSFNPHAAIGDGNSYTKTFWLYQGDDGRKQTNIFSPPAPRFYFINEGNYQYRVGLGNEYTTTFQLPVHPVNTWSYVAIVFDSSSSEIKVYQNGNSSPVMTHSYTGDGVLPNGNLYFSEVRPPQRLHYPFTGRLDEVAIYNRALTSEEIQQNYQNGLGGLGCGTIMNVSITNMEVDLEEGKFEIKGYLDLNDPDFADLILDPQSTILLKLQTGGTEEEPEFGIVGGDQIQLSTGDDSEELKFELEGDNSE